MKHECDVFDVKWSGKHPSLCFGEWTILKNGENVSNLIPDDLKKSPMNTSMVYFDAVDYELLREEYADGPYFYKDGEDVDDWIRSNQWICAFCDSDEEKIELYNAIHKNDWRHRTCGGCI